MMKPSYREILRSKLQEKTDRNRRYSLRAFAKDLGLSPALLSQVLGGKRGMSETMARDVASKLKLTAVQQAYFCDLVAADHAKSDTKKTQAQERLKNYDRTKIKQLGLEYFRHIHEWHHYAILECIGLKDFQSSTSWLAKKLSIEEIKIRIAVERLEEVGLLKITPEGKWLDTHAHVQIRLDAEATKLALQQYAHLGMEALTKVPMTNRENAAFVMSVDSKRIEEAKKVLADFNQSFIEKFNASDDEKDAVFVLATQFFPVTT
jgi:uncharacterized protein (TIGR02147 family)